MARKKSIEKPKAGSHNSPDLPADANTSYVFFLACFIAGAVGCGLTHGLLVPLDLIKVRMQVNPTKYTSTYKGYQIIYKEGGLSALYLGWVPTVIGYGLQGAFKFAGYEYFLVKFTPMFQSRIVVVMAAGAVAEFIADFALCPFEAVKLRMQTNRSYAHKSMFFVMRHMYQTEGFLVFYKGLVPLWCRQIPYTIVKFVSFDYILRYLYVNVVPKPRADCTMLEQLSVTFLAGYLSGVFVALVSQPPDYVLSKMSADKHATITGILMEAGFFGVWHGLLLRILIIGTLTGLQWFTYDIFKLIVINMQGGLKPKE